MRYLVRARVKSGREADLLKAIEGETLGRGSVAEGEYLRNMQDARLCEDQTARWVEVCYCPTPLQEERPYWEQYFDLTRVQDAHDRRKCRDENGTESWACGDCDCTARLEKKLQTSGKSFLLRADSRREVRSVGCSQVSSGSVDASCFKSCATSLKLKTSAQKGSMRSSAKGVVTRCSRSLGQIGIEVARSPRRGPLISKPTPGVRTASARKAKVCAVCSTSAGSEGIRSGCRRSVHVERAVFGHRRQAPPHLVCLVHEGLESALVESRKASSLRASSIC